MASLTNTASSPADMVAQLATWLVGTVGWTLVDTVSASDKVLLFSDGDTKVPVYCRITASVISDTPGIFPDSAFDNVTFRLYRSWNTQTHTGYGEVGSRQRTYLAPAYGKNSYGDAYWSWATKWQTDLYPFDSEWFNSSAFITETSSNVSYNGRSFFVKTGEYIKSFSYATRFWGNVSYAISLNSATQVHTVDRLTGKEYLWGANFATAGACWQRYDILENTTSNMADPPWGAYKSGNPVLHAWDGDNYIYFSKSDAAGTAFARYNISGNTWESLASMTSLGTWNLSFGCIIGCAKMLYLPASLTGFAQDFIYTCDYVNAAGIVKWTRYGVTSNAWEVGPTAELPNIPAGLNCGYVKKMWYDPAFGEKGSICFCHPSTISSSAYTHMHVFDVNTQTWSTLDVPSNWRAFSSVLSTDTNYRNNFVQPQYDQAGSLRLPASDATLSFTAIADSGHVKVVATWKPISGTKDITSFVYVGFYDSYLKTDRFTLTAPLSPGKVVTVNVAESVTGKLIQGDCIEIFDPTAQVQPLWRTQAYVGGGGEILRVTEILSANSFKVECVNAEYPAGAYLGQDIAGAVIGNESMEFLCLRSPKGYLANGVGDSYIARPPGDRFPSNGSHTSTFIDWRNCTVVSPYQLMHYATSMATYGCVGQLKGVTTASPRATNNTFEVMPDGNYLVFIPYMKDRSNDTRLLQMGPL